ncbi:MAG: hypothetical protein LBP29_10410 [Treponema sp.]|jgi:hypothetical protein|nr:hypothetical protein [Treponema sp.]
MRFPRQSLVLLCFVLSVSLYAQEEEAPPIESDWSGYLPSVYSRGDQTFHFHLGLGFPLFYADQEKGILDTKMNLGGLATLSYNYFLNSHWFLGGELSGAFFSTEGKNNYFIVPMGFRAGYQFIFRRLEFPLTLMVGFAPQQRLGGSYFGLFAKPSASVFFRFSPDWSFGINAAFWWVPQWTGKRDEPSVANGNSGNINIHGFFLETSIGVRYHF